MRNAISKLYSPQGDDALLPDNAVDGVERASVVASLLRRQTACEQISQRPKMNKSTPL